MERHKYVTRKDDKHTYAIHFVVILARHIFIQHVNVCYAGQTTEYSMYGKFFFVLEEEHIIYVN